ncbi:class I SAM-dependent methyltransferase [Rufibacter psychrotolerans]|uniref:class I SAM-dependent methyltransferase n=1 Tax=Rufibacter psychrotolerans TaxID=2812556 RepID=UPI0019671E95|nr:class I SAM-dependent methyltransferase [Rufibacter sp. SYSU D00308]
MKKGQISNFLRQARLLYLTDWLRYHLQAYKNSKANQRFRKEHPGVVLPPDYLMYESFQLNYDKYYRGGRETAQWLTHHLSRHTALEDKKILDWGCGPGRIIRHLPELVGNGCQYFGTDYNARSIAWCARHLPHIKFHHNGLAAALPYPDAFFDVIYGISIFTHLSEQLHHDWFLELQRVLRPGGILFLTTQGDNFKPKLTAAEVQQYTRGELVVRGNVKEGHRTYSAFHPKPFMQRLFAGARVLEHLEPAPEPGKGLPQDIWIIQKPLA